MATQLHVLGEVQYRTVRLDDLITDGRFNRPVSDSMVERILSDFNARAFSTIDIWERDDGALVILDGQHRVEAARRRGVPPDAKVIPAVVRRGLTLDQAAELFVQLNETKLVSAYDKFHALRTAGHAQSLGMDATVRAHGLVIARSAADGAISCVDALRRVYGMGEPEGAVLGHTLAAIYKAWGDASEAYRSAVIRGIALYFHDHRDIHPEAVGEALARGPGAPIQLLSWAKVIAGPQRMSLDRAVAQVIEQRVMKRHGRPKSA